jgi:preprotein translocase subunit SecG
MIQYLKRNPYLVIYLMVIAFASVLFGLGKIFRGLEWYLDKSGMILAIVFSVIGIVLSSALWYFRNHPEDSESDNKVNE